jgi:nitroimidazol reductase NimA-like FMN-containing flavoprotein (pyridoxamine 5'-phosphate oxidase superfamily)
VPDAVPEWPPGTVAVLSTAGAEGGPHAIPVSTALRAGPRTVVFALAASRGSLARLQSDPRVALTVLAHDDVAVTLHGRARVIEAPLRGADAVVGVVLEVEGVHDHNQPTFVIDEGARWHWVDDAARGRDGEVRAALERLAASLRDP